MSRSFLVTFLMAFISINAEAQISSYAEIKELEGKIVTLKKAVITKDYFSVINKDLSKAKCQITEYITGTITNEIKPDLPNKIVAGTNLTIKDVRLIGNSSKIVEGEFWFPYITLNGFVGRAGASFIFSFETADGNYFDASIGCYVNGGTRYSKKAIEQDLVDMLNGIIID